MRQEMTEDALSSCQGVLHHVFEQQRKSSQHGLVIAVTSPSGGEGVSSLSRALLRELEDPDISDGVVLDLGLLLQPKNQATTTDGSTWTKTLSKSTPRANYQSCREQIVAQRALHHFTLLDCPALSASSDVLRIASLVDGIILVLEAERTRKEQIREAERQLVASGGRVLGHILNKRKYQLPKWLYDRL